jgi:hypothetical protein
VRWSEATTEPVNERDQRGGDRATGDRGLAAAGRSGGLPAAAATVVGGSVQFSDVLLGVDLGESGMHG